MVSSEVPHVLSTMYCDVISSQQPTFDLSFVIQQLMILHISSYRSAVWVLYTESTPSLHDR